MKNIYSWRLRYYKPEEQITFLDRLLFALAEIPRFIRWHGVLGAWKPIKNIWR